MYNTYHDDGFELLAFPSNQFGCQAPGTSEIERAYAWRKFGFEFPVMDKIAVKDKPTRCKGIDPVAASEFANDPDALFAAPLVDDPTSSAAISPVYAFLKSKPPFDAEIEWNYTKFLIGRDGQVLRRYSPGDPLDQGMEDDVKRALRGEPLRQRR